MIRMATICSGIGAPEVASAGLNFSHQFVAEIEPFPSAVLAHHWPHVPNLGDMTKINGEEWRGQVDVLVGGTPCQAFSVAGKRESLNDERGNLTLKFVELCDAINPAYVVWENVPGVLSTVDNAFGCFLGALSGNDGELFPAGVGWSNSGCVIGPRRKLAWRILDAQYFGLAQRRRRVFVVACPRGGADPCEILFEREGVQRHSPPSREKGEGASATLESRSRAGGFPGTDGACGGHVVPVCGGGPENGQIAGTVSRKWSKGSGGPAGDECYNMVATFQQSSLAGRGTFGFDPDAKVAKPVKTQMDGQMVCITGPITHALKSDGFDGSEDGTGRGQPIVCQEVADTITNCFHKHHGASSGKDSLPRNHVIAIQERAICENPMAGPDGVGVRTDDCAYTLEARTVPQAVAFNVFGGNKRKDRPEGGFYVEENPDATKALDAAGGLNPACSQGGVCVAFAQNQLGEVRTGEVANTLNTNFNASGRNTPCVAFHQNQRAEVTLNDTAGSLKVGGGKPGQGYPAIQTAMQVRRLTPVECERLQGFPDGYTDIPWRNKPVSECPDGPRYKALGNSMAVPCMRWILARLSA